MPHSKIAVSIEESVLARLDRLVEESVFQNRSQAVQTSIEEKLSRLKRSRLARECAKLDPREEIAMAEEGLAQDFAEWPEY